MEPTSPKDQSVGQMPLSKSSIHHQAWSIALEVGYTEPYERLLSDADLLMEGSQEMILQTRGRS